MTDLSGIRALCRKRFMNRVAEVEGSDAPGRSMLEQDASLLREEMSKQDITMTPETIKILTLGWAFAMHQFDVVGNEASFDIMSVLIALLAEYDTEG